jgi:hypothetical protein
MDPVIRTNTKARVNLACPECGMNLKKAPNGGFAKYGDTYCCQGCADGTGCTCYAGTETRKSFNRPGDVGWRNAENTERDRNFNAEVDTSSRVIGEGRDRTAPRYKSRDKSKKDPSKTEPEAKRLKAQNKPRDSMREPSRGRSEERGRLGVRGGYFRTDRVSATATKGKK